MYIALYNKTQASDFWLRVKTFYNKTNPIFKFLLVSFYTAFLTFEDLRKGRGLNMYNKDRGMHKITDIIDWLGGLPYQPAFSDDVEKFYKDHGYELVKFQPTVYHKPTYPKTFFYKYFVYLKQVGTGCNEFIFKKL